MKTQFDIIIVGGGMVGLAMAAALVKTNLSIAIVERADFSDLEEGGYLLSQPVKAEDYTTRVSAISPGNQAFLSSLNCWQNLPADRVADYDKMFVWDGNGSGQIQFDAAEIAKDKLGSIVENQAIRASIYQAISNFSNIEFFTHAHIESINQLDDSTELVFTDAKGLSSQKTISAKLLIGADGAFSTVRQKLAIEIDQMAYQQIAFVANVLTEKPHNNTAWQRFTSFGPIAFLPLPQANLCSIVWSIDSDKADVLKSLSKQEFADKLAENFEHQLGKVTAVSEFQGFPLVKRHAHRYLSHRCVLIGDAAHTIHPLAGQGVNLGFQDVACLSEQIIGQIKKNRDFGLTANLRPFERQRKAENVLMQEAMSGFKWLFGNQSMPAVLTRNWAMSAVDRSGFIKQAIIERAMS